MSRESLKNVEEIVWLEDPSKYEYLREARYTTTQRKGKIGLNGKGRLIGYENVEKKEKKRPVYFRRYWWLTPYDRGMPKEDEGYGKKNKQNLKPEEAVSPEDIQIPERAEIIKKHEKSN